jgi:hypothetical protein
MQNLTMACVVVIRRISTGDVVKDTVTNIIKWVEFLEEYLCQRFGLHLRQISKICRDDSGFGSPSGPTVFFTFNNFQKGWSLWGGSSYTLVAKGDLEDRQPPCLILEKGKSLLDVMHISDNLDGLNNKDDMKVLNLVPSLSNSSNLPLSAKVDVSQINLNEEECSENPSGNDIREQLNEPQGIAPQLNGNQKIKVYQISALQSFLFGHSELACFVKNNLFVTGQVECLPSSYFGDIIFDLPPIEDDAKRGDWV